MAFRILPDRRFVWIAAGTASTTPFVLMFIGALLEAISLKQFPDEHDIQSYLAIAVIGVLVGSLTAIIFLLPLGMVWRWSLKVVGGFGVSQLTAAMISILLQCLFAGILVTLVSLAVFNPSTLTEMRERYIDILIVNLWLIGSALAPALFFTWLFYRDNQSEL